MNKNEALKLALEALEEYVNVVVSVNDPNKWTPKVADAGEPARKAIIAIKEALAQPEHFQVSPLEFVEMVMEKEHLIGNPIFWSEWPNKEKNT